MANSYATRFPARFRTAALALLVLLAREPARGQTVPAPLENEAGRLEHDEQSEFSHIRIRRRGTVRSMIFVRDTGEEVLESRIDLRKPHVLQFEYLKFLFTSYLVRPQQEDVLIVGLGGGGMVHFIRRIDPAVRIDAVEIDPAVVRLAQRFFDVRSAGTTRIITADGFKFIAETEKQYDAIYMDAFLKPSTATDETGAPLELRTRQFYEQLRKRLKPGGVVAFNLNPHADLEGDVRAIAEAFPQVYVFPLARFGGAVVLASTSPDRLQPAELARQGKELDRRFPAAVRFEEMAARVYRGR